MISSFEKAIEDAVRRAYISGRTGESLARRMNDAVRQAVKDYGAKATLRAGRDYAKQVVTKLDAESLKAFSTDRDVATKAMKNSSKFVMDFAKRLDKVDEKASKNIIKAMTSLNPGETDWRTAARAAMQKAGLAKHHAKTEIETFSAAMDRARVVDTALKGGIRRFLFDGPSGTQRPYCKDKVGKVFDIDEIRGSDNGQGLPGIYYCGGFGCRHRLVPVYDTILETKVSQGMKSDIVNEDYSELRKSIKENLPGGLTENINYIDGRIFDLKKEVGFVLDKKGNCIADFEADNESPDEFYIDGNLKGATLIHNHPIDVTFSPDDIETALISELAKIIVVREKIKETLIFRKINKGTALSALSDEMAYASAMGLKDSEFSEYVLDGFVNKIKEVKREISHR